ncbi:hypothetical protein L204_101856 [Cryptococcus depauperatus]
MGFSRTNSISSRHGSTDSNDALRAAQLWKKSLKATNSSDYPLITDSSPRHINDENCNARLVREAKHTRDTYEKEIQGERAISASLRERIALLEEKVWKSTAEVEIVTAREKEAKVFLQYVEEQMLRDKDARERDRKDLQDWVRRDKISAERISRLQEERDKAIEEIGKLRNDRDAPGLTALQQVNPNITLSPSHSCSDALTKTSLSHPVSTGFCMSPEHLQLQHNAIKAAYDKLLQKHDEDLRHFRTYVATQKERAERKKKRKEEKANKFQSSAYKGQLIEETNEKYNAKTETVNQKRCDHQIPSPLKLVAKVDHDGIEFSARTSVRSATSSATTTTHISSAKAKTYEKALNHANSKPSTCLIEPQIRAPEQQQTNTDANFLSLSARTSSTTTTSSKNSPLIRDRLGSNIIRKAVLLRTVDERCYHEKPSYLPLTDSIACKSSELNVKRKEIDMEGLSPAEKAAKRKNISKLSAPKKKELYREYKRGGRYMVPQDLRPDIFEEYAIDPQQNEGAAFAFHNTKRKKAERKTMHGGDCECCKDYYDAVGVMPRFNTGPEWRGTSDCPEKDEHEGIKQHRDKISRHRETWIKPPTPPGYWQIGFPTTQEVEEQNRKADEMAEDKKEQIRREADQKESRWRKKV